MKKSLFILLAALALVTVSASSAWAAPKNGGDKAPGGGKTSTPIGYDISYPQCGSKLPTDHAFGIVGVNGGLATTENPCLADQLTWAARASGVIEAQPKIQLYVNTANPGEVIDQIDTWPTTGTTPYGDCDATNSAACSWQYGYERARNDVEIFAAAARAAGISPLAGDYTWWLDVETANSWQSGDESALARNRATLEGMTAYFVGQDASVGIYSTNYQWGIIAGTVPSDSNLYYLDNWMAGARTLKGAQDNCRNAPLTGGGTITLTQYVARGLDHNFSCI